MAQAWRMAVTELKHRWLGLVGMVMLSVLAGYIIGNELIGYSLYGLDRGTVVTTVVFDFLLIALLPCFGGITMGREYFSISSTISDEPFLRRLRFYRMYPIPLDLIVWSRIFFMLICFFVTVPLLLLIATSLAWPQIATNMTGLEFFGFLLIWFSYTLATVGFIPYLEFGHNGKVLIFSSVLLSVLLFLALILYHLWIGHSLFMLTIQAAQAYSWIPGAVMLLVAAIAILLWKNKLKSRIVMRDFP